MAFPHPKSRKDHYRKGDITNNRGVVWKFFKRTINITGYRNAKDDVNPAKDRTFGGIIHDWSVNLFIGETAFIYSGLTRHEISDREDL
jgi:hypothetical protein